MKRMKKQLFVLIFILLKRINMLRKKTILGTIIILLLSLGNLGIGATPRVELKEFNSKNNASNYSRDTSVVKVYSKVDVHSTVDSKLPPETVQILDSLLNTKEAKREFYLLWFQQKLSTEIKEYKQNKKLEARARLVYPITTLFCFLLLLIISKEKRVLTWLLIITATVSLNCTLYFIKDIYLYLIKNITPSLLYLLQ